MLKIFGDLRSGNCLKVKWTAEVLGMAYGWQDIDIMSGASRTEDYLKINRAGQVPAVILADGRPLAQSNAIILHLAEGTDLVPTDPYDRAKVFEWLFWEQYSHEPYIAVARFQCLYLGKPAEALDHKIVERGYGALERMEEHLKDRAYLVSDHLTVADISLVAYTRVAHQGGFDLGHFPAIQDWVKRIETDLKILDPT